MADTSNRGLGTTVGWARMADTSNRGLEYLSGLDWARVADTRRLVWSLGTTAGRAGLGPEYHSGRALLEDAKGSHYKSLLMGWGMVRALTPTLVATVQG